MKKEKTYCLNVDCPFKDCDKHICHCQNEIALVANFDGVCKKYISYLLNECMGG